MFLHHQLLPEQKINADEAETSAKQFSAKQVEARNGILTGNHISIFNCFALTYFFVTEADIWLLGPISLSLSESFIGSGSFKAE